MRTLKFHCLKCADCCRDLLKTVRIEGTMFQEGLHLYPEEVKKLKNLAYQYEGEVTIRPKWKASSTNKVIAYQLVNHSCPFLRENVCRIYSKRPLSCRFYPRTSWGSIDSSCRWVKKHGVDKPLKEGEITIVSRQLHEAFKKVSSKLYELILKNAPRRQLILYDFKGKKKTTIDAKKFLNRYRSDNR
ncbi:MAG: YkgJ family cysteine cluster protein [Candidatus Korarchaeota archaeon]|nr:YkgJ family cysteine cluster protein [Candidatus Korarchaeota archaeon]NIU83270.1 hypothetical protein [Candidatus Thorarchaeota archaeon]NIW13614.1 hypothetical protein [Candidatus Thorarchaeota archaeon]